MDRKEVEARRPVHPVRRRRRRAGDGGRGTQRSRRSRHRSRSHRRHHRRGIGGLKSFEEQHDVYRERGPSKISPFFIPMFIADIAAGIVSMRFNAKGPNYATVSACATSAHAIGDAFRTIQYGDADIMITGGAEATVTPMAIGGFANMKALSERNDSPATASRPFDATRDGFVMGEGAGIVILEELEHARARGATIYAEIVGYGATGDAYHLTAPAPDGEGAQRAMKRAMRDAQLTPADVDYINAHGTSTPANDLNETQAIKAVFGEYAKSVNVSSTKSTTGHMLGAAGAVEFIVVHAGRARGNDPADDQLRTSRSRARPELHAERRRQARRDRRHKQQLWFRWPQCVSCRSALRGVASRTA